MNTTPWASQPAQCKAWSCTTTNSDLIDGLCFWHRPRADQQPITDEQWPLINAVEKHAHDHYNDGGWDVIVECWDPYMIRDDLTRRGAGTPDEAIRAFEVYVDIYADRQADARNSAF
jgi:hypothetical protein